MSCEGRPGPAASSALTPAAMAHLHSLCFQTPRPWRAAEFADLLSGSGCFALGTPGAFLLGRVIADEAELLTLAVAPDQRRQGHARRLVGQFLAESTARAATSAFLEVAADNAAAMDLYLAAGWAQTGLRRGYYRTPEGGRVDARLMGISLP